MYYIYKIKNSINSKLYIGKTNDITVRWQSHCSEAKLHRKLYPLYHAMNKYSIDNFTLEIIEEMDNERLCLDREIYWIEFYKTNITKYGSEFGYNLSEGGEGPSGYIFTAEQRKSKSDNQMGAKNSFYGKKHSLQSKKKIANSRSGKPLSIDTRNKISQKLVGVPKKQETKDKMSASATGKEKSPEHCKNISLSKIGKSNNRPGSKHHNAKLLEQDVIDMRKYFDTSPDKSKDKIKFLSEKYNLSRSGIQQIVYRTKWKHLS
jgi:group I intron endonuclease